MEPKIVKNGEFIEVIGHYDDPVLCAKMTLLAELYAVEHRSGYAKFRLEDEDKLKAVDGRLEFRDTSNLYIYSNDGSTELYATSESEGAIQLEVTATGADGYVYSGSKTFKGFSKTLGSTTAEYTEGDYITAKYPGSATYYIVEGSASISIDLSTLSGWEALSTGDHIVTVRALADGYESGGLSNGVTVTKGASSYTVSVSNVGKTVTYVYDGDTKLEDLSSGSTTTYTISSGEIKFIPGLYFNTSYTASTGSVSITENETNEIKATISGNGGTVTIYSAKAD